MSEKLCPCPGRKCGCLATPHVIQTATEMVVARLEEIIHDIKHGRETTDGKKIDWDQLTRSQLLDLLSLLGLPVY